LVVELPVGVAVDAHLVCHERVQSDDLALAVTDDLRIGIAPNKEMVHQRFSKHKGSHLGIRLVVEQIVKRMADNLLLTAIRFVLVNMERQPRDCLGQYPDAGIYCRGLHGRPFVHGLAAGRAAEQKTDCTAKPVLRFIPRPEQSGKHAHKINNPLSS